MTDTINTAMTRREWGLLLALSLIWGSSFFFIAIGLRELPPFTLVAIRLVLAAMILAVALLATGARLPRRPGTWAMFAAMGATNAALPFSLITWGQTLIPGGLASILNATTPLFTVLAAHVFTADERMTVARVAGVVIGFLGVAVMIGGDAFREGAGHALAQFAILGASASYALSAVFARRFRSMGIPPMVAATGQMISAAVLMIPVSLVFDRPWELAAPSGATWAAMLGLALIPTFIAYVIYYRLVASAGSVNVMLVTFLIPVTAILLGSALLGERLSPGHFLGMAAIGVGLAVIDGRPLRFLRRGA